MKDILSAEQMGLAVALGSGMLIGLERERRKGQGPNRRAAGLRTFMVAALAGAVAQILSSTLAAVVLAGVAVMAALSYWRSRSHDPGMTTELALVSTALIGMLAIPHPGLAGACAALLAGVLAARERLHRFATEWLTQDELHDGLLLSALVLVLLPLLPATPLEWLGQMSPRQVLQLVVVILLMQAMGHVARRLLGVRAGLALSGLLGGFVSSTATISAMGGMAREGRASTRLAACAAVLSMAATWVQLLLMAAVVAPNLISHLWALAAVGVSVPLVVGLVLWEQASEGASSGPVVREGRALRVREALMVTGLLVGGALFVSLARQQGTAGLMMGTALAAFADAHAPMASLMALAAAGSLPDAMLLQGLMVALGANGVTRASAAWLTGGRRFGALVAGALLLNLACAGGWLAWWPH